jgi:hypothetical protein
MLTKETLIKEIEKYGCGNLRYLPLEYMSLTEIIHHLEECNCPKIKELMRKFAKQYHETKQPLAK